ncbi:hypothetical protein ACFLIM_31765 [Nonomuraea sp. M3C6]|uniref:Uncharacterized protein n=1 Tax=Nonomuraea marmarensis TaxID=3351344 RepID=A0ABW7AKA0_9ACTN
MKSSVLVASRSELDRLFRAASAGPIPVGDADGRVLIAPGTPLGRAVMVLVKALVWDGKVFDRSRDELVNKLTPVGVRAIRACVYRGPSLVDGGECLVLDYSRTSLVARWIRDEIRLVAPGVYLGVVFVRGRRVFEFALRFAGPA